MTQKNFTTLDSDGCDIEFVFELNGMAHLQQVEYKLQIILIYVVSCATL